MRSVRLAKHSYIYGELSVACRSVGRVGNCHVYGGCVRGVDRPVKFIIIYESLRSGLSRANGGQHAFCCPPFVHAPCIDAVAVIHAVHALMSPVFACIIDNEPFL